MIRGEGEAGTENKRDCHVMVQEGSGVEIESKYAGMFGDHVKALVQRRLDELDTDAMVAIEERGCYDYVVLARLEAALRRSGVEQLSDEMAERSMPLRELRRSRMYVPGNNPRMLNKAGMYGADCLILDLEDSVAVDHKLDARYLVKNALQQLDFGGAELWVRINKMSAKEDISVVKYGSPHGICLPKAEDPEDIVILENMLEEEGLDAAIMPIVETARGIRNVEAIAGASDAVVALAFGAEDFSADVCGRRAWNALLYPRSRLVVAARSQGVQPLDTVYADVNDMEGLREETMAVIEMGFDGKGAIHPGQLPVIHDCFTPDDAEVEAAREIIAAVEKARRKGLGSASLHGKMIDLPVEKRARRILRRAGVE